MRTLLIRLDDATYRALNRIAPAARRRRSQFIRDALRKAIFQAELDAMRAAYLARPDSEAEADDWTTAEAYAE